MKEYKITCMNKGQRTDWCYVIAHSRDEALKRYLGFTAIYDEDILQIKEV